MAMTGTVSSDRLCGAMAMAQIPSQAIPANRPTMRRLSSALLRIWHDLPYCVASARKDTDSSMNPTSARLISKAERQQRVIGS
jgi:hypothetical protein